MTASLVLATQNRGKVAELRDILEGLDVVLLGATDVDLPHVEETGDTFAANALLKARAGVAASGLACVADDSGLAIDALDGAPGIYSARWAARHGVAPGPAGADRANLELVLRQLADVPAAGRTASFVCAAVLALPDGSHEEVVATIDGTLLDAPRGEGGFGYDPIFTPLGEGRTMAEMSGAEKHAISHRGKAFRGLYPAIARHLAAGGAD